MVHVAEVVISRLRTWKEENWLLGVDACRPRRWRAPLVFERREEASHIESEISNGIIVGDRVA
jgi:hypothetical protein